MQSKTKGEFTPALSIEGMYVLDQCALIEVRCAEIYRHFAQVSDLQELETLWKKTALEEDHHALQFDMLSRLKGEGIAAVKADTAGIAAVLKNLQSLFDKIRKSRVSPIDCLKLGIKLEELPKPVPLQFRSNMQ